MTSEIRKLVQGEKMKRKIRVKRAQSNPIYWLFIVGFLLGVLVPNIMWKEVYTQADLVSAYLLECLGNIESEQSALSYEVIQKRTWSALLVSLCGISVFGVPVSVLIITCLGFEFGSILTSSILQFGMQGGLVGSVLIFPHGFLYTAGMFGVCTLSYRKSLEAWHTQSVFNRELYKYIGKSFLFLLLIGAGMALEIYCSPELLKIILKNLKIFS